jgi:hypothetical protein
MIHEDLLLLERLWHRLLGEVFSARILAQQLMQDGGLDIQGLSVDDLTELIGGTFSGNWREVAFAFSELLASYMAQEQMGQSLSDRQVVAWAAAVFLIADVLTRGEPYFDHKFGKFLTVLLAVRGKLEESEIIYIAQRFFSAQTWGSSM